MDLGVWGGEGSFGICYEAAEKGLPYGRRPSAAIKPTVRNMFIAALKALLHPKKTYRMHSSESYSGDDGDRAFGADDEGSAGGVGADGVESGRGFFGWTDASGVSGWMEIVNEFGSDEE